MRMKCNGPKPAHCEISTDAIIEIISLILVGCPFGQPVPQNRSFRHYAFVDGFVRVLLLRYLGTCVVLFILPMTDGSYSKYDVQAILA